MEKKLSLIAKNLTINIGKITLLKNISFHAKTGDVIAVIGPNGAGKSSLFKTIMHHYAYQVKTGELIFNNQNLLPLPTEKIAKLGFFYLSQNPLEIEGIKLVDLYKTIFNTNQTKKIDPFGLYKIVSPKFKELNLDLQLLKRDNNVSFSGGQKKKNELMQMFLMNNKVLLLDELDSGCDTDSIKIIAKEINRIKDKKIIFLISHQEKLFQLIKPTKYFLIANKTIIKKGIGKNVIKEINNGFKQYEYNSKKIKIDSLKNVFH